MRGSYPLLLAALTVALTGYVATNGWASVLVWLLPSIVLGVAVLAVVGVVRRGRGSR